MLSSTSLISLSLFFTLSSAIPVPSMVGRASFTLSNGELAQSQNAQFATLTTASTCTDGELACVNGQFAQCVGTSFQVTGCAGGTKCFSLPLVNKAGTSITCDTEADAVSRIAATGAPGGLTGSGSTSAVTTSGSTKDTTTTSTLASTSSFALANGEAAQKLNLEFQSLTTSSSCTEGTNACVNGDFAQCVGGTFVLNPCSGGTQCFALPLVNSAGTSITCDTEANAISRIEATGATGGLTGSGSTSTSKSSKASSTTTTTTTSPSATPSVSTTTASDATSSFALSNGQAAQKLNKEFESLTTSSTCTSGENACVNGEFAQCVNGAFVLESCGGGSVQCFALPLVNSAGTSITCATQAEALSRIEATGATGGLTGSN